MAAEPRDTRLLDLLREQATEDAREFLRDRTYDCLPATFAGAPLIACCGFCGKELPADKAIVSERGFAYCRQACADRAAKYA